MRVRRVIVIAFASFLILLSIIFVPVFCTRINVVEHNINLFVTRPIRYVYFDAESIFDSWSVSPSPSLVNGSLVLNCSGGKSFRLEGVISNLTILDPGESIRFYLNVEAFGPFSIGLSANASGDGGIFFKNFTPLDIVRDESFFGLMSPPLILDNGTYDISLIIYGYGYGVIKIHSVFVGIHFSLLGEFNGFSFDLSLIVYDERDSVYHLGEVYTYLAVIPKDGWAVDRLFFETTLSYSYEPGKIGPDLIFSWAYWSYCARYRNGYWIEYYSSYTPDPDYPKDVGGGDTVYGNESYGFSTHFKYFGSFPFKIKSKVRWLFFMTKLRYGSLSCDQSIFSIFPFNFRFGFVIGRIYDAYLYNWIGGLEKYTFNVTISITNTN